MKLGVAVLAVLILPLTATGCSKARNATGACVNAAAPGVGVKAVDCSHPHTGVVVKAVDHASDCPPGTWHYTTRLMKIKCVRPQTSATAG